MGQGHERDDRKQFTPVQRPEDGEGIRDKVLSKRIEIGINDAMD